MKVMITGAGGMLGQAVTDDFQRRGWDVIGLRHADLDVTDADAVMRAVERVRPAVIVHAAAFTRVDEAEDAVETAFEVNARAVETVARAAGSVGARLVYPSTDYVFDGAATTPYGVTDTTNPINAYGRSKLAGEQAARTETDCLVVRTSALFGAGNNFVRTVGGALSKGQPLRVVDDQRTAPTWTVDLAATLGALLEKSAPAGVYHATNAGSASWYELAGEVARLLGYEDGISACPTSEYPTKARRPAYSVLDCSRTEAIVGAARPWQNALADAIAQGAF